VAASDASTNAAERDLVITRVFDAPRELVFKAWTEPEHLMRWWGPHDWTLAHCTIDFRPGGVWHYGMRGPQGEESWGKAVFREIVEPERIVSTVTFADADGNVVPPTHYGLGPSWPHEMLATVTFAEYQGKTLVTLRMTLGTAPASEREIVQQGWNESFDELADYLQTV
jgi:uncharacterized protein YndB with AHSA1/START domain